MNKGLKDKSFHSNIGHMVMNNHKPTLKEFCQIYPVLLAQAREYAEGTIVDSVEHDDAVDSCIRDFMEGSAWWQYGEFKNEDSAYILLLGAQ